MDGWPSALFLSASLSALAFLPPPTEGSIRCYCNIERCAITGYMCVSHANRCFSKLFNSNKTGGSGVADVHGCLDLLPVRQRGICDGYRSGDLVKTSESGDALIMCCLDDLCNYKANQDALVDVAKVNISLGAERTPPVAHPRSTNTVGGPGAESYSGLGWNADGSQNGSRGSASDAWFMAAVVAVPIAGGLILVVLVLVAVRMLQYDGQRVARENGVAKARLFIDRHFGGNGYRLYGNVCSEPHCQCRGGSPVTQVSHWDGDDHSSCSTSDFTRDCGGSANSAECHVLDRDVSAAVALQGRREHPTKRDQLSEDSRPTPAFV